MIRHNIRGVGRLIYLIQARPDITYAVNIASQFMHEQRSIHLEAAYRILRYLKSAPGKGILFARNGNLNMEAYIAADWVGCTNDRRSTLGYCVFVGGNLVAWKSKKQSVVSRSSAEANRSMAQGICELMWLRMLMRDLRLQSKDPTKLYCDNKKAINFAHNSVEANDMPWRFGKHYKRSGKSGSTANLAFGMIFTTRNYLSCCNFCYKQFCY